MNAPVVSTTLGQIKGRIAQDVNGNNYYSFQGVPFAKPPIGDLRFKAPRPVDPWSGTLNATKERDSSYQRHFLLNEVIGSEDCLYLNVYTKRLGGTDLRPVMVWIYGGSFISGSSEERFVGPRYLITEDIVLVTVTYRVGIFGFLSLDDPSLGVPGNAGLKDQVMALKWVRQHIGAFGGDPGNVTIFGESAGAGCVHLLMLSPMAKGLFHKAIAQSGTALNPWSIANAFSKTLATNLNIVPYNEQQLYDRLMKATKEEILRFQDALPDPSDASVRRVHGPVIENTPASTADAAKEEVFVADDPSNVIRSGNYAKVPLMIGYTSREGMLAAVLAGNKRDAQFFGIDFERMLPHDLRLRRGSAESACAARRVKSFYFGQKEPSQETIDEIFKLKSDVFFVRGLLEAVRRHAPQQPVYLYRFSMDGASNLYKRFSKIEEKGACHGDDLGYLFDMDAVPKYEPNTDEELTVKRMVKLWTNFAKYGDPNAKVKDPSIGVEWKRVTDLQKIDFLDIDKSLTVGINPDHERIAFWEELSRMKRKC